MHKAVLMHADIDECTEIDDVAHRTAHLHAGLQVLHVLDVAAQDGTGQLVTRVAAGLFKLRDDVF